MNQFRDLNDTSLAMDIVNALEAESNIISHFAVDLAGVASNKIEVEDLLPDDSEVHILVLEEPTKYMVVVPDNQAPNSLENSRQTGFDCATEAAKFVSMLTNPL